MAGNCAVISDQVFSREHPFLSIMLPTGYRVTFMRPPAVRRPIMAMRRLLREPIPLSRYVETKVMTAKQAAQMKVMVLEARNVLISGGVGSGKTTLTRALLEVVPHHERIVTVEDPAELWLRSKDGENFLGQLWVALEACPSFDMAALLEVIITLTS